MSVEHALPYIRGWSSSPIPNFSLSASGLLALADLQTVSNRTKIAGGSSWLDAFVLAPGLHYEQASNVVQDKGNTDAVEETPPDQEDINHIINNAALLNYLKRVRAGGGTGDITLDVGTNHDTQMTKMLSTLRFMLLNRRPQLKRRVLAAEKDAREFDWFSNFLYLASPLLTLVSMVFMILLRDWWGFTTIVALMVSRTLNIFAIKMRVSGVKPADTPVPAPSRGDDQSPPSAPSTAHSDSQQITQYCVNLGNGRKVILRGTRADLQAVTTQEWMKAKSHIDGFLEAAAKLLVYLVAAFSGNCTQAGNIIQLLLLVVSAALLGLSNARSSGFSTHGRTAEAELPPMKKKPSGGKPGKIEIGHGVEVWPVDSRDSGYGEGLDIVGGIITDPEKSQSSGGAAVIPPGRRQPAGAPPPMYGGQQGALGSNNMDGGLSSLVRSPRGANPYGGHNPSADTYYSATHPQGTSSPYIGSPIRSSVRKPGTTPPRRISDDPFTEIGPRFDHSNPYSPIHQYELASRPIDTPPRFNSQNRRDRQRRYENQAAQAQADIQAVQRQDRPPPPRSQAPSSGTRYPPRSAYNRLGQPEPEEDEEAEPTEENPSLDEKTEYGERSGDPVVYAPGNQPVFSHARVRAGNVRYGGLRSN